jgi:2'-5' RNA ligase
MPGSARKSGREVATVRGFFAFGIKPDFSAELKRALDAFPPDPNLKPLLPADYHVTIKFLSEFSSTDFFACLGELSALGPPPPNSLAAARLALWPTVLALECEPGDALVQWQSQVNALLERKGFKKERHPRFRPHITLARRKPGQKLPRIEAHLESGQKKFEGKIIPLESPALWKSQAEETGRRHQPLLSVLFR